MNAVDNPHIDRLLKASARDEQTLMFELPDEIFGFHAQQAIEKLYKALITSHGQEFEFVHNLDPLIQQLTALGECLPGLPLSSKALNEYSVEARYDAGVPLLPDQRNALRIAIAELRQFVEKRRQELGQASAQIRDFS